MANKNQWKPNLLCPVCGQTFLLDVGDICSVCFWENDAYQYENRNECGGANNLSLNDYKKWWNALESILPRLIKKYNIAIPEKTFWKYDEMMVPRESIVDFVNEMTKHNIKLRASFYFLCDKYLFDNMTFEGFPFIESNNVKENNDEIINIIFSKNPIMICKKYGLEQVIEILQESSDTLKTWQHLTPRICVMLNPNILPKI